MASRSPVSAAWWRCSSAPSARRAVAGRPENTTAVNNLFADFGAGEAMNPFAIYKAGKEVKAEREIAQGSSYYSKWNRGRLDLLVDKAGTRLRRTRTFT